MVKFKEWSKGGGKEGAGGGIVKEGDRYIRIDTVMKAAYLPKT